MPRHGDNAQFRLDPNIALVRRDRPAQVGSLFTLSKVGSDGFAAKVCPQLGGTQAPKNRRSAVDNVSEPQHGASPREPPGLCLPLNSKLWRTHVPVPISLAIPVDASDPLCAGDEAGIGRQAGT